MTDDDLRAELARRLDAVRQRIAAACGRVGRDPAGVTLVAVTKTVGVRVAALLPGLGVNDFGESRPQELAKKQAAIPAGRFHLIGHLQRNKLDKTIPLTHLTHSADSLRLLEALDAFGRKTGVPVPLLLEVNCSREEAKGGLTVEDLPAVAERFRTFPGVEVRGLMTMAAYTGDAAQVRATFVELVALRDTLREATGLALPELSMGMSNDFEAGVELGATYVRVGSTLFAGLEDLGEPGA